MYPSAFKNMYPYKQIVKQKKAEFALSGSNHLFVLKCSETHDPLVGHFLYSHISSVLPPYLIKDLVLMFKDSIILCTIIVNNYLLCYITKQIDEK